MMYINMDWLENNKNKKEIQKLLNKREQIVFDVTINNKYIKGYQRKLKRLTKEIELLYFLGGTTCQRNTEN